jgi:DNA-binding transcriptional LysR family regulator
MDTLSNLRTFLAVARTESFSAAARELGIAPSVVTKRIGQLEAQIQGALFERTTRRVRLTPVGRGHLPSVQRVVADAEELFANPIGARDQLQGQLRIKAPTSVTVCLIGPLLERFQRLYPLLHLEVVALDRAVNPAEEGFDLALTMMPDAYAGVVEEALCPMPRTACAAPRYLHERGQPRHPGDLKDHAILNFLPTGSVWSFDSAAGRLSVKVQPRLNTNEAQLLLSAALAGNGIAILGDYLARPALDAGTLVPLLADFPLDAFWLKALLPENRANVPKVQALVRHLRAELAQPQHNPGLSR